MSTQITHKKMLQITANSEFKNLFRAVLRQGDFDFDNLQDIYNYGIAGGFCGFIYYSDTVAFFNRNRKTIMQLCESYADDLGVNVYEMIAGFNYLKGFNAIDVVEALNGRGDYVTYVKNALSWFAAEEAARFIVESIEA